MIALVRTFFCKIALFVNHEFEKESYFLRSHYCFLAIPIIPQQRTYANYSIREITNDSNDFTDKNNLPKFLPQPPQVEEKFENTCDRKNNDDYNY
ncbi:MAG: hypothetical protein GPJ51_00180 [Candidatus Heimdallarchaeota archaeon]|nr:hypothetical protein [Candidatus Heimdallarchaeota archaeon]